MVDKFPDLQEATIQQLQDGLAAGDFTSVDLVKAYLRRTEEVNELLKAVLWTSPVALAQAEKLDAERKGGTLRGPLHGIPITIKDNIATRVEDGMDTTAGSFALKGAIVKGDAYVVEKLKEAGAIVISKTNLSEWANFRYNRPGAWSPIGGQCTSPYYPQGHPSGSSSGTGVAVAVGLAAGGLGTETRGSIMSPASRCSLVGVRPTPGLVPGRGVIPITSLKDSVGPMCRTVTDAAHLLQVIAAPEVVIGKPVNYLEGLKKDALKGQKLLVPRNLITYTDSSVHESMQPVFEEAVNTLVSLGAIVEDIEVEAEHLALNKDLDEPWNVATDTEFVDQIEKHLKEYSHIPSGVRNLRDIVDFAEKHPEESPKTYESSERFVNALKRGPLDSVAYKEAFEALSRAGKAIDAQLEKHNASAMLLVSPILSWWGFSAYPQVTVPLGFIADDVKPSNERAPWRDEFATKTWTLHPNLPFGLTFGGPAFSEATLIAFAYAFEQASQARLKSKTYAEATPHTQLLDIVAA